MSNLSLGVYIQAGACLPKFDTLKKFIDIISQLGYKRLYLGIGENFYVKKQPYLAHMIGRYNTDDIRLIDSYAKSREIELIPAIQTLAHFHSIPCYAQYKPMMDHGHVLLADNEKTYEFINDILEAISEAFSTRRIMIGMDEAHMLGAGRYYDLHGHVDRGQILLKHLRRVISLAGQYEFKCEMWSDMFFKLKNMENYNDENMLAPKELLGQLPSDLRIVHWNYGVQEVENHRRVLREHKKMTDNVSMTGGLFKWVGFAPNNTYSMKANRNLISAVKSEGIEELNFAMWCDNGGEASLFSILPALFDGAITAGMVDEKKAKDLFESLAGMRMDEFLLADYLNYPHFQEIREVGNSCFYYLYMDPLLSTFHSLVGEGLPSAYARYAEKVKACQKGQFGYLFEMYYALAKVLELKASLGVEIKDAYQKGDKQTLQKLAAEVIPELIQRLDAFFAVFEKQWHIENSSMGFEIHCARIGALRFRLKYVSEFLQSYCDGKVERIAELEEETLPFAYVENAKADTYQLMCWNNIFTQGINW